MNSRGFEFPASPWPDGQDRVDEMLSDFRYRILRRYLRRPMAPAAQVAAARTRSKLTEVQRVTIARSKEPRAVLAERYGVTERTIYYTRKKFRHVRSK